MVIIIGPDPDREPTLDELRFKARIAVLESALKSAEDAFNTIIGDITNAFAQRPAWTDSHKTTLVWKTQPLAGKQRDALEAIRTNAQQAKENE